jgi:hypothetical protein
MSPQMNGEPREPLAAAEAGTAPAPAASTRGDRPLLERINTEGVTRTIVPRQDVANEDAKLANEEAKLAPLFTREATIDFRSRWDLVQRSFVDNPREAVNAGDELVVQVIETLTETFSTQRSQLESGLQQTDQSSTENLRLALRRYRSFFERLLSI